MKRFLPFILGLMLVLSACSSETQTSKDWTAAELAQAVLDGIGLDGSTLERTDERLDEDGLTAYVVGYYGQEEGSWEDCVIYRAGGAEALEIAVLRMKSGTDMEAALDGLNGYIYSREGDFTGYSPEQAAIVHDSTAVTHGEYLALLICSEPEYAQDAFYGMFDSGEGSAVPSDTAEPSESPTDSTQPTEEPSEASAEPTETPEPSAEQSETPEPSAEQTETPEPSAEQTETPEPSAEQSETPEPSEKPTESAKPSTKPKETSKATTVPAESEKPSVEPTEPVPAQAEHEEELQEQQPSETAMASTEPSTEPSATQASTPPGRYPFNPPGIDDMTPYDTTAIRTAWDTGDTSSLSKRDKVIYDRCKEVIAEVITDGMSEVEKERALFDWIVTNTTYDMDHYDRLAKLDPDSSNPYGPLHNGKGICLGYATTFQLFMDLCNIECITVIGSAFRCAEDHAWNMVCIDGKWYCVDVTWDNRTGRYFNVTSQFMADTDHQWDYSSVPEAT